VIKLLWKPSKTIKYSEINDEEFLVFEKYFNRFLDAMVRKGVITFKKLPEDVPVEAYSARYRKYVVIDPFSIYVPYHYDETIWGAYYKYDWIENDLKGYLKRVLSVYKPKILFSFDQEPRILGKVLYKGIAAYFSHIYHHILAHNVIEDVISILKKYNVEVDYPPFKAPIEERFCEYMAFNANPPRTLNRILEFIGKEPTKEMLDITKSLFGLKDRELNISDGEYETLKIILYEHWERHSDNIYSPEVVKDASFILPIWRSLWATHKFSWKTIEEPKDEIWERIFWIKY